MRENRETPDRDQHRQVPGTLAATWLLPPESEPHGERGSKGKRRGSSAQEVSWDIPDDVVLDQMHPDPPVS